MTTARQAPQHLIHVGYAKTGSSLLREWFASHPEIGYRHGAFAGFARPQDVAREAPGVRLRVTSSEQLASPATDGPSHRGAPLEAQAAVCRTLKELYPNARILIVTRGFRSMIMSSYSQYVRSGGWISLPELMENARDENAWHYDALISLYRQSFGDRVTILPWELMRDDLDAFLRHLSQLYGLTQHSLPPRRVNASLSPIEMRWYPVLSGAVRRAPVGERLRARLVRRFQRYSHANRLSGIVRVLQRVAPAAPVEARMITDPVLEGFRGRAACLAADPLFEPYRKDYLND
jgi:hypothetical protein